MNTRHIPVDEWRSALDRISHTYEGSVVSTEIVGGNVGAQEQVHEQPLRGITSDRSGITLSFEKKGGLRLDHCIAHPRAVRIAETEDGRIIALEIEDDVNTHTLVKFRSPMRPELLDPSVE